MERRFRVRLEELRGDAETVIVAPGHAADGAPDGSFDGYELMRLTARAP